MGLPARAFPFRTRRGGTGLNGPLFALAAAPFFLCCDEAPAGAGPAAADEPAALVRAEKRDARPNGSAEFPYETEPVGGTGERTASKRVIDAYERLKDSRPGEALPEIRELLSGDLTPWERALLLRFAARFELERGNHEQAITDIEASSETGALDDEEETENLRFLGILYLNTDPPSYDKAIENLGKFVARAKSPGSDDYIFLAMALAQLGRYEEAIPHAEKAIALSKTPNEAYYLTLNYCYIGLRRYEDAEALLERMVQLFPESKKAAEMLEKLRSRHKETGKIEKNGSEAR